MLSLCDQVFQLVPIGETKKEDRLGLHAFPTRAHRLQRWFGVRHFLIISSVASGFFFFPRKRWGWEIYWTSLGFLKDGYLYVDISIYTSYIIYIDTNRCISRRGVYWILFSGADLKYFFLASQMTWRSPLTTWKMLGRTWWLRLESGDHNDLPIHHCIKMVRFSNRILWKGPQQKDWWNILHLKVDGYLLPPLDFWDPRSFPQKKHVGQDWLWKIWFESTGCTVSSETFK